MHVENSECERKLKIVCPCTKCINNYSKSRAFFFFLLFLTRNCTRISRRSSISLNVCRPLRLPHSGGATFELFIRSWNEAYRNIITKNDNNEPLDDNRIKINKFVLTEMYQKRLCRWESARGCVGTREMSCVAAGGEASPFSVTQRYYENCADCALRFNWPTRSYVNWYIFDLFPRTVRDNVLRA